MTATVFPADFRRRSKRGAYAEHREHQLARGYCLIGYDICEIYLVPGTSACRPCREKNTDLQRARTARLSQTVSVPVVVPIGRRSGSTRVREHVAALTHDGLLMRYVERAGLDPETSARRFPNGSACDLVWPAKKLLIEAKPKVSRAEVQKALGELADYIRFLPGYRKALLVPESLTDDLAALCKTEGVRVLVMEAE